MQSLEAEINIPSQDQSEVGLNFDSRRQPEQNDSEDDQLEDIDALPPSLRNARFPQSNTPELVLGEPQSQPSNTFVKRESMPFIPAGDVPRYRPTNHRFNHIRPKSATDETTNKDHRHQPTVLQHNRRAGNVKLSRMYSISVADSGDEIQDTKWISASTKNLQTNSKAGSRIKKQGSVRPMPASRLSTPSVSLSESKTIIKTAGKVKKDGTPYLRNLHDQTKGYSMTHSAVDYRQRKEVQKQYQARLAELLDADVVDQVEAEGGITPEGRLFKAAVRMMEKLIDERGDRAKIEPPLDVCIVSPVSKPEIDEIEDVRKRANRAEDKIASLKTALQGIIGD